MRSVINIYRGWLLGKSHRPPLMSVAHEEVKIINKYRRGWEEGPFLNL